MYVMYVCTLHVHMYVMCTAKLFYIISYYIHVVTSMYVVHMYMTCVMIIYFIDYTIFCLMQRHKIHCLLRSLIGLNTVTFLVE